MASSRRPRAVWCASARACATVEPSSPSPTACRRSARATAMASPCATGASDSASCTTSLRNSTHKAAPTPFGCRSWCRYEAREDPGEVWEMTAGAHGLRVLVVDDEELARLRLRSLVEECAQPRAR